MSDSPRLCGICGENPVGPGGIMCPDCFAPAPEDAPYRDHVELEPGDRVGWVGPDGVVHVGTVAEHREHPEGSGNWTLTVGDELPPRSPAESALAWLNASFPDADQWTREQIREERLRPLGDLPILDDPELVWPRPLGDSSSAPELDTIDPANGEQPRIAGGS